MDKVQNYYLFISLILQKYDDFLRDVFEEFNILYLHVVDTSVVTRQPSDSR